VTALLASPAVAIVLAMVASVCFAGAAVLQHRAVSAGSGSTEDPAVKYGSETISLSGLRAVARTPGWLLGLALAAGGTTLHALALVLAPLTVVQPVGVLAVPIAVVLSVLRTGRRPASGVMIGVALTVAGVAGFVGTAAGTAVSTPAPDSATLMAAVIVFGLVAALAAVGLTRTGWVRCIACATAGAVAFGLVSALLRAVSQTITTGEAGLLDPAVLAAGVGIVAAVSVGGWLVQQAFASGAPEVVVACLTVVDPIVAVLLGVVLLGEGAATSPHTWLLLIGAAATATTGVVALASHHPDAAGRATAPPARPALAARHAVRRIPVTPRRPATSGWRGRTATSRRERLLNRR
jgi:drug/metabolite transporter (DMT)-like permease